MVEPVTKEGVKRLEISCKAREEYLSEFKLRNQGLVTSGFSDGAATAHQPTQTGNSNVQAISVFSSSIDKHRGNPLLTEGLPRANEINKSTLKPLWPPKRETKVTSVKSPFGEVSGINTSRPSVAVSQIDIDTHQPSPASILGVSQLPSREVEIVIPASTADDSSQAFFSQNYQASPEVEAEMTINYPLTHLDRVKSALPRIYAELEKLDAGFTFGYDIFPNEKELDDVEDMAIFTGRFSTILT